MGLFRQSEEQKREQGRKNQKEAEKLKDVTDQQLIMTMLLEMDACCVQTFYDGPVGAEAMERSGYNPY